MARDYIVTLGLHQQSVAGTVSIPVEHEHVYELTATGAATVTLDGEPGSQVAVVWSGEAGTVNGQPVADGETWVAVMLSAGWRMYPVGDPAPPAPPTQVTPTIPTFDDLSSTIVLAADVGVEWRVDGVVTAAGSVPVSAPASVTVTATALSGYEIVGTSSWSHSFPAPPVTPTAPDELTGLLGWFDPSDVASVTLDGSTRVEAIAAQAGSGGGMTQATVENRPFTATMNGLSALKTDSSVNTTQNLRAPNYAVFPDEGTLFVVARADSAAEAWNAVSGFETKMIIYLNATSALSLGTPNMSSPTVQGRAYFLAVSHDAATNTRRLYVDGVEVATAAMSATTFGFHQLCGGSGNNTIGDFGAYDRPLTSGEVESLYVWAKGKWGLP